MYFKQLVVSVIMFFTVSVFAQTPLKLPAILSNHAVLQQNANVKLWGWGPSKYKVKIVCSWKPEDTLSVTPGKDCSWSVVTKTPKAGGPYSITFNCEKQHITISDILVGEVWLCSGQSNMEFAFNSPQGVLDAGDAVDKSANNQLRFFKLSHNFSVFPLPNSDGEWKISSPATTLSMSVAGYFFGKTLNEKLNNTPVGMIASYWGGTSVQVWTPSEVYQQDAQLKGDANNLSPATWSPTEPSVLYNAMIYPFIKYNIAGAIWYQGEGNSERPELYGRLFEGLIKGWRKAFESDFPFYFVQIAPWHGYEHNKGAVLREQQQSVLHLPKTGMISVGDLVDDINDIHPRIKKEVGMRLVNMVLKDQYHQDQLNPYFPSFKSLSIKNGVAYVTCKTTGLLTIKPLSNSNFELAGADQKFYPALARIEKNGIIEVSSSAVKNPIDIRYCYSNDAVPEIFDSNGLPLLPFRTDNR